MPETLTRPDPTRPDPRVDPTRVHPWFIHLVGVLCVCKYEVNDIFHLSSEFLFFSDWVGTVRSVFTARCYADGGIAVASRLFICLSVCLSVCLSICARNVEVFCHIVWVTSKIIAHIIRTGSSISAAPEEISLVQGEHPQISGGIGVRYGKVRVQSTKAVISLKRDKTQKKLILASYKKSCPMCRFMPKCTTLNDL